MRIFTKTYLLLCLGFLSFTGMTLAQTTVTLNASKDNTIYSENNNSNGAGTGLFTGRTNNNTLRRALVQFDLSQIPAGASISSAELQITGSRQSTSNANIHRLTSDWGEGTSVAPGQQGGGATPATNDATWNFNFFNSSSWNSAGGDFVAVASASTNVNNNSAASWSGEGVIADVQAWVNGEADNFGWIIIANENNDGTAVRMRSRESTSSVPQLIITYELQEEPMAESKAYRAYLTGRNQVPSVLSLAQGMINASLQDDTLSLSGTIDNLSSALATDIAGGVHIHLAYAGQSGGVEVVLNPTLNSDSTEVIFEEAQNTFALSTEQIAALENRQLYINVHTRNYPGGEIRGQILPAADTYYASNLYGSYEVPVVMSQASGSAAIEIHGDTMVLTGSINNLEGDFAAEIGGGAHIHLGYAGQNGGVEIPLVATVAEDLRSATFSAAQNTFILTPDQAAALEDRQLYINIHTQKATSGEIRGQIVGGASLGLMRGHLSGTNEVPITTSSADGMVILEILNETTIKASGAFNNLEDELATDLAGGAHLHQGMAGQAGSVIVPLAVSSDDNRSGVFEAMLNEHEIGMEEVSRLMKRGVYVNIHSLKNLSGELRGQFLPEGPINFTAFLSAIFEVPEVVTKATGALKAELVGNTLTLSGSFADLSSPLNLDILGGAHIHLGYAGQTGGVVVPLASTLDDGNSAGVFEAANNKFELTDEQVSQLKGRQMYINIHSTLVASGELRGQLLNEANAYYVAPLSGASEAPAVNTEATGMLVLELNGTKGYVSGYLSGLEGNFATEIAGGAHIHNGLAGQNGAIAQVLNGTQGDDLTEVSFALVDNVFDVSAGFIDTLSNRENYVNIHSSAHNSGEIRGQLLPLANNYFTVTLEGQHEVPAVVSPASGALKMELIGNNLLVSGRFDNLIGTVATEIDGGYLASHIHLGSVGTNGAVQFALNPEVDGDELGGYYQADSNRFELTDEQVDALLANDWYVNIHSKPFESGELRGQILPEINRFPIGGEITFPTNGASVSIEGAANEIFGPTWSSGQDRDKLGYTWELGLDPGFLLGAAISEKVAGDTTIQLELGIIDSLLNVAGLPIGGSALLFHRVRTSDGNLTATTSSALVNLTRGTVTSTNNLFADLNEFVVFPTITTNDLTVRIDAKEKIDGVIHLIDPMGRVLSQRAIRYPAQSTSLESFDVSTLVPGNYYISILSKGQIATRLFIVK